MATFGGGMTPANFYTGLNKLPYFNILAYGATTASDDNVTEIQATINAAAVSGGIVYIPAGTYKTGKLTTYYNVTIEGDGIGSVLQSIAAEALIESIYTAYYFPNGGIKNLVLDGDSIGTIGFNTQMVCCFTIDGVYFHHFVTYGINFQGSLVGLINNCYFYYNAIAVNGKGITVPATSMANLVTFKECQFAHNTTWGVKWEDGSLLRFENCDLELNGTSANYATGSVYVKNGDGTTTGNTPSLYMQGCWFERNNGWMVFIDESAVNTMSSICDSVFWYNSADDGHNIKIVGAAKENRLLLRACDFADVFNLTIDGAKALVVNDNCYLEGTVTLANSGRYIRQRDWNGRVIAPQFIAALTDDTPSDSEIDAATGLTPATAGAGWQCTIKDSSGSGLLYKIESDGTSWYYTKLTAAI